MEAVWLYSLGEWGIEQADRYIDDLTIAFEFLRAVQKRDHFVKTSEPDTVRTRSFAT